MTTKHDDPYYKASLSGNLDLIKYMLDKNVAGYEPNWALYGAALGGNKAICRFHYKRGATDHKWGVGAAALGGHSTLLKWFFKKCDPKNTKLIIWSAIENACLGGHQCIVEALFPNVAEEDRIYVLSTALYRAASGIHFTLINYLISLGANDWVAGLRGAAQSCSLPMINFFIEKGVDNWYPAFRLLTQSQNTKAKSLINILYNRTNFKKKEIECLIENAELWNNWEIAFLLNKKL